VLELVTVWDGSHQGIGADLLCCAADVPREPPKTMTCRTSGAQKALVHLSQRPMTVADLEAACGWKKPQTARHAIYQLRHCGAIPASALKSRRVTDGTTRTWLEYWIES
jgi:hypothetical protein